MKRRKKRVCKTCGRPLTVHTTDILRLPVSYEPEESIKKGESEKINVYYCRICDGFRTSVE